MTLRKPTRREQQRGVAMIMALLALLLLAVIGMAFMFMTTTESSANKNYKDSQRAYFASRAGLENVRALLWSDANFSAQVAGLAMPNIANNGMIYVVNPTGGEVIDPRANAALDNELCQERYAQLVATVAPGTLGAPCGTGGAGELMPPASTYYKLAAVPAAPPAAAPDIPLPAADIPNTGTTSALPFKWVRITNKQNLMGLLNKTVDGSLIGGPGAGSQVCWNGKQEVVMAPGVSCALWNAIPANSFNQANPVWLLTSMAITPAGSRRMTQMEVAYTPPIYPDGAITALAPITITGSLAVNAYDNCTCTATGAPLVAGGTCNSGAYAVASGTGVSQNGSSATLTSGQPTPTTVLNPFPYKVPDIITSYLDSGVVNVGVTGPNQATSCSGTPNFTATPAVYANCSNITGKNGVTNFGQFPTDPNNMPATSSPQMTYVPGSVSLHSDVSGSGVLIIDGDLNVNGGLSWYGLVLVRGRMSFTGGSSQPVNVYGAILAGADVNAQDQFIADKVGGSFSFHYDTCALKQDAPPGPPKLLATHELMY